MRHLRRDWDRLAGALPTGARGLLVVAALSLAAAALEAGVLVLVVATALGVTDGRDTIALPVADADLSTTVALVLAAAASLLSLLGHVAVSTRTARMSAAVSRTVRDRALTAYARASWDRQARDREGALQETVTTLAQQSSQMAMQYATLLANATSLLALFAIALVVDPLTTAGVVVFSGLVVVALRPVTSRSRRHATTWVRENASFAERVASWTSMVMDLRAFGVEHVKDQELADANGRAAHAMFQTRLAGRLGPALYKDVALLLLVGAVAAVHAAGDVDLAAAGSVVLLVVRSVNYAQQAQAALQQVDEMSPSLEELLVRVASLEAEAEADGGRPLASVGTLALEGVGYDYEPGRTGLAGVDLVLEAGAALGVAGPSGGGKSTLVQLLVRLRRPTAGRITASGVPYEEVAAADWHRLVALVPQEPRLVEGTVAENIAFFREGITAADVERAAAAAHVLDDIRALPAGMATRLGPRGAGLSGGQKQRVAIARALAGRPEVLVLDEPTSALDVRSEELLRRTIADLRGTVTLVIVAHRLSTLESCDRVLLVRAGRAEAVGPREEVLAALDREAP